MGDGDAEAEAEGDGVVVNTLMSGIMKDSRRTVNVQKGQKTGGESEKRDGMRWLSTESWALRL
jgi:hypothetical protein